MYNKKILKILLCCFLSMSLVSNLNGIIDDQNNNDDFTYLSHEVRRAFTALEQALPEHEWSLAFKNLCQDIQKEGDVVIYGPILSVVDECLTVLEKHEKDIRLNSFELAIQEYKKALIAGEFYVSVDDEPIVRDRCKVKRFCKICVDFLRVTGGLIVDGLTNLNGPLFVNGTETINGQLVVNGDETINGDLTLTGTLRAIALFINGVEITDNSACCATINSKVDDLIVQLNEQTAIINAGFAETFTALADIRQQEAIIESKIDICCNTLNSKIDACCSTLNSKIDNLTQIVVADFAQTFTLLADIRQEETTIESKIDVCCTTLNSKIDNLTHIVIADFAGTFTAIAALQSSSSSGACAAIAVTAPTTITAPGTYCVANTINGPITVSASNVTLDLNSFPINGAVTTTGSDITVKNGTIQNATPAVNNSGSNVVFENLIIQASNGATGSSSAQAPGGNGGNSIGITNSGNYCTITECNVFSGNGGTGGSGSTSAPGRGLSGGNGGNCYAIYNTGSNLILLKNRIISSSGGGGGQGGVGLSIGFGDQAGGNGGTGANSYGIYLDSTGFEILIVDCVCQATQGGAGGAGGNGSSRENSSDPFTTFYGAGGAGNLGGLAIGIYINSGDTIEILQSDIMGGLGGAGGNGNYGTPGGAGGNGGGLSDGIYHNNPINVKVSECNIQTANGGAGGNGGIVQPDSAAPGNGGNGGNGGSSGSGINLFAGSNYKIIGCLINKTGTGGLGGTGGTGAAGGGSGTNGRFGDSGDGVRNINTSSKGVIQNCTISNIGDGQSVGLAINDQSASNSCMIFTNYAFNIFGGSQAYALKSGNAIDATAGTAFTSGNNVLQNLYQ